MIVKVHSLFSLLIGSFIVVTIYLYIFILCISHKKQDRNKNSLKYKLTKWDIAPFVATPLNGGFVVFL